MTATSLSGLEEPWLDLAGRVPGATLYQSYAWCEAWVSACAFLDRSEDVRIVTVWEDARLVLLWPLAVRRVGGTGVLHALAEPATQYCDLLVEPSPQAAEWVELAWRQVQKERGVDLVHLRNVRRDSGLETYSNGRFRESAVRACSAPFTLLAPTGTGERGKPRGGRSLNALKRHLRNLEKHGAVSFEIVPSHSHAAVVAEALAMKRRWLLTRGEVSSGYGHPANETVIMEMAMKHRFTVIRMTVGGETAAIEIGALDRGYYYSLIQSYDQKFAAHSPGRLLLQNILSRSDTGIRRFDFLPPPHPHKLEWTDTAVEVSSYAIPRNLKGRVASFYVGTGRTVLKTAFRRLPLRLRRRLMRSPDRAD